jgi:hypothetical protein
MMSFFPVFQKIRKIPLPISLRNEKSKEDLSHENAEDMVDAIYKSYPVESRSKMEIGFWESYGFLQYIKFSYFFKKI